MDNNTKEMIEKGAKVYAIVAIAPVVMVVGFFALCWVGIIFHMFG